tara:strand:+ start:855 stop:1289 length:435 start_codon:yes stop_codon:yes gene_type:complete
MPNHCHNRVTFYSEDTTVILRLHEIFKSDNIFTQFIPEPDWKNTPNDKGELPIQPDKDSMMPPSFPDGTTDDRWYSWRLANWGTKWDAYEVEIDDSELHYGFEVSFDTAWSPPEEICYAIKEQFDDVSVSWFFDEPGMEVAGYL